MTYTRDDALFDLERLARGYAISSHDLSVKITRRRLNHIRHGAPPNDGERCLLNSYLDSRGMNLPHLP